MVSKSIKITERKYLVEYNVEAVWCNNVCYTTEAVYIPTYNNDALNIVLRRLQSILNI